MKTCRVVLLGEISSQNEVELDFTLLSPEASNTVITEVPNTTSTVDVLSPSDSTTLRDIDRDDILSDNDSEPDILNPAVQNEVVLGGVENEGNDNISDIVWSEIAIPVNTDVVGSGLPQFLGNSRNLGKPTVKNCKRMTPLGLYKTYYSDSLMSIFVESTNSFARNSNISRWTDVTINEMHRFHAILLIIITG
jgi:hypothetical protein